MEQEKQYTRENLKEKISRCKKLVWLGVITAVTGVTLALYPLQQLKYPSLPKTVSEYNDSESSIELLKKRKKSLESKLSQEKLEEFDSVIKIIQDEAFESEKSQEFIDYQKMKKRYGEELNEILVKNYLPGIAMLISGGMVGGIMKRREEKYKTQLKEYKDKN